MKRRLAGMILAFALVLNTSFSFGLDVPATDYYVFDLDLSISLPDEWDVDIFEGDFAPDNGFYFIEAGDETNFFYLYATDTDMEDFRLAPHWEITDYAMERYQFGIESGVDGMSPYVLSDREIPYCILGWTFDWGNGEIANQLEALTSLDGTLYYYFLMSYDKELEELVELLESVLANVTYYGLGETGVSIREYSYDDLPNSTANRQLSDFERFLSDEGTNTVRMGSLITTIASYMIYFFVFVGFLRFFLNRLRKASGNGMEEPRRTTSRSAGQNWKELRQQGTSPDGQTAPSQTRVNTYFTDNRIVKDKGYQLDQLSSLYEAGMVSREEFLDRKAKLDKEL